MDVDGLLSWYERVRRPLPWRETSDPYHILVSEVMLQQTQVDRVLPKYHEWLTKYPSLQCVAFTDRPVREPVADAATLTEAMAALISEIMWAGADPDQMPPEELLRALTRDRRYMFESAGLYDRLPWKVAF